MRLGQLAATAVVHQEGVIAMIALVGLGVRDGSPLTGLLPRSGWSEALAVGAVVGLVLVAAQLALRWLEPFQQLERIQGQLVGHWSVADSVAVAAVSGLAEEALARALLQPLIGLLGASAVFALLHVVPDRRAWLWPLLALAAGVALGLVFERWGFPAAAAAHITLNAVGLLHLRRVARVYNNAGGE
jgi:membrane protease YdiL (CAAX protease family)